MKLIFLLALTVTVALSARLPPDITQGLIPPDQSFNFNSLRICAFNIKVFGKAKMGKPHVVEVLLDILEDYDITLIQEIRDISGTAIEELLELLNERIIGDHFIMEISERLGRTSSKEQYAYFYRNSVFSHIKSYQWPEDRERNDWFERPPFISHFRANGYDAGDFGYLGIHVKPDDAVAEIDHMADVYDAMVGSIWTGSQSVNGYILGGDFNAGCSYVRPGDWENIRLRARTNTFTWVIGDDVDTTVSPTSCPYDRFVLTGHIRNTYVSNSAAAFNFRDEYGLTDEQTKEVSDHWPISMRSNREAAPLPSTQGSTQLDSNEFAMILLLTSHYYVNIYEQ